MRIDVKKHSGVLDDTPKHLLDETIGPFITDEKRKTCLEENHVGRYITLLARYEISKFPYFENFLRTEIDLVDDGVSLVLD